MPFLIQVSFQLAFVFAHAFFSTNVFAEQLQFYAPTKKVVSSISHISGKNFFSAKGKQFWISSLTIGAKATDRLPPTYRFYIQSGLHGNEEFTTVFAHWLIKRIESGESRLNNLPIGTVIDFLPIANPDSFGSHRYNANDVNLNRNFNVLWGLSSEPTGNNSFSEPETKAIKALFQKRDYLAAIDLHGYLDWLVLPSPHTYVKNHPTANEKQPVYQAWKSRMIKAQRKHLTHYKLKTAGGLGDGGAFEDWAFWEEGVLSVCLELSQPTRVIYDAKKDKIVDSFLKYEGFIAEVFSSAISMEKEKIEHLFARSIYPINLVDSQPFMLSSRQ